MSPLGGARQARIRIEVVYATTESQDLARLDLPAGSTALAAIRASGLLERHREIDLKHGRIGIFGKVVVPDAVLAHGDRVEIYRPMRADPKLARRARTR